MKTITVTEILVYYDGVDVFVGHDLIGGNYIGMIVDRVDGIDHYLVTGVSPNGLRRFRSGTLDLRTLLLEAQRMSGSLHRQMANRTSHLSFIRSPARF